MLKSARGLTLVLAEVPKSHATLTIENYLKWYGASVCVVFPDGRVQEVNAEQYANAEESFIKRRDVHNTTTWSDHVISPQFFAHIAKVFGYTIDNRAYEMVVGRWSIQYEGRYEL